MNRVADIRRARPLLGTLVDIRASGIKPAQAVEAAFREVEDIHRLMSFHEPASDISRLNRAALGEPVAVDARTFEVLLFAANLSLASHGAFDVTVGGKLAVDGLLPRPEEQPCDEDVSFHDIALLPGHRVMRACHAWIDLGGIAKGYAVDRAIQVLQSHGITNGLVNAGGDLRLFGAPQPVHIRHPFDASMIVPLGNMAECAVASSSDMYGHEPLVSPRDGARVPWQQGITVIAPQCMAADALTKVVRLLPCHALDILTDFGARAIIMDRHGARLLLPEVPKAKAA